MPVGRNIYKYNWYRYGYTYFEHIFYSLIRMIGASEFQIRAAFHPSIIISKTIKEKSDPNVFYLANK